MQGKQKARPKTWHQIRRQRSEQGGFEPVFGGQLQLQRLEDLALHGVDLGHAAGRRIAAQCDLMELDAPGDLQRPVGRVVAVGVLELHAHDAMQHQREEADQRVRANAVWQAVEHRRDLDVGLQHPEAALDVGQALVAADDFSHWHVGDVGHQQQLAVVELCAPQRALVDAVAEGLALQVDLDDGAQPRLEDRAVQPRLSGCLRLPLQPALRSARAGGHPHR